VGSTGNKGFRKYEDEYGMKSTPHHNIMGETEHPTEYSR